MMNKSKIKVMVVDDSMVFRKFLIDGLPKAQQRIEIVGYAINPYDAMKKIPVLKPDVITMDIEMPGMTGIDFLKECLPKYPIPVILCSTLNVSVLDALSYGAVDFVRKPDMSGSNSMNLFINNLATKVLVASQAKVRIAANAGGASAAGKPAANGSGSKSVPASVIRFKPNANNLRLNNTVIAIGASTGGTEATLDVLRQLPADIPGIVITQHMPKGFTQMYADRLNKLCQMEVREAKDGDVIRRGLALIAPGGDTHMKVVKKGRDYVVRCLEGDKVNGHRPSVDVLFKSVAETIKSNAIGMILTGMGQDGAYGLLEMKNAGAYTFGQDRESSVVYGMPHVAYSIGAVNCQASCTALAGALMKHLNSF